MYEDLEASPWNEVGHEHDQVYINDKGTSVCVS